MRRVCCAEHTRADLARRGIAEAGRGLPSIETGMPLPAGTGLSRRSFLARTGGLALTVYGASLLGPKAFEQGIAEAAAQQGKTLVSIFFDGGADALSMLAPVNDPKYQQLRPNLGLKPNEGTPWSEDTRLHWHPSATPLQKLHSEGKVTVFPGIGYTGADQSHFTSRHYWEVGELNTHTNTGWMGRLLDIVGTMDNPLQGISLDGSLSPGLATGRVPVAATWGPSYELWAPGVWDPIDDMMFKSLEKIGAAGEKGKDPAMKTAGEALRQSTQLRSQLLPFGSEITSPVPYPDEEHFSQSLAGLAAMLKANLPIRCAAMTAPGSYDTHDDQIEAFSSGVKQTCDTLLAFQRDLEARGIADRVVTLLWSEFGRRPEENGSGTDHGAGGNAFLIGSPVKGKMVGEWPGPQRARRRRQPPQHLRLPRRLLRAARAVLRSGRRRRDPRRLGLRPADADRMKRRLTAGLATVAAAAAAFALGFAGASSAAGALSGEQAAAGRAKVPNRMLVRASEFDLTLSRGQIGPGPALIQYQNDGEDPHDLQIRRQKGGVTKTVDELEPGALGSVELRLKKGARYVLWCSLQNHRALGMEAKLKVKRKPVS